MTTGFENRTASWRGNGSSLTNEFIPKIFSLSSGSHRLIVLGREYNVAIDNFKIIPVVNTSVVTNSPCTNFVTNTVFLDRWFTNTINRTNLVNNYITNTAYIDRWFTNTINMTNYIDKFYTNTITQIITNTVTNTVVNNITNTVIPDILDAYTFLNKTNKTLEIKVNFQ